MKVGVGLPVTTPGVTGQRLLAWARAAEEAGFASLAAIDRIVWPGFEPLTALAGAAAVTSRVGLRTNVLLAPTRRPALLAKQATTVDRLSGGRLMLGLGVGRRTDDYAAVGATFRDRGRRLDRDLGVLRTSGIPLLFGGSLEVALPRILASGEGWTVAVRPAEEVGRLAAELRDAWDAAGREGRAYVMAMHYFALGADSSVDYLYEYYGYLGDRARTIAEGAIRSAGQAAESVAAFTEAGVDEYVLVPTMATLEQLDRLAAAVVR